MEFEGKKKKSIQTIVGLVAGAVTFLLVKQLFFKTPSFEEDMMQATIDLNKTCPMMVDEETRLDSAMVLSENIISYYYTLVNVDNASIEIEAFRQNMEPILINHVKTNPELKIYRDHKVTLAYHYKDKDGVFLVAISVTPDRYSSP